MSTSSPALSTLPHHSSSIPPHSHIAAPSRSFEFSVSTLNSFLEIFVYPVLELLPWCIQHGPECLLFVCTEIFVRFILLGQPYRHTAEVESQGITDSDALINGEEILLSLIRDAKSKIKIITTLLSLAFVLMQALTSDSWPSLSAGIYASIISLFMSILLYIVALWWYKAIIRGGGAGRWFSHAHNTTATPFLLDPWVALSIPFMWMFWSFILLFLVTVISAWDSSSAVLAPPASAGAPIQSLRAGHGERKGAVLTVLTLGLGCCVAVSVTWRQYL